MSTAGDDFQITVDSEAFMIVPRGDIDMATAAQFERAIQQLTADQNGQPLVVDLANVGFIDSSGLRVLITAWEASHHVTIRNARPQAEHLFTVSGVDQFLPIERASDI